MSVKMKRTKIVSTIGPATDDKDVIQQIINEGVDVIRQNFSHVDHEAHAEIYSRVRDVSDRVAMMADTKGPEIRLGQVEEGTELEPGDKVDIKDTEQEGNKEMLPINYGDLPKHVEKGDEIRIDDGKIELEVEESSDGKIEAEVIFGGEVASRKAVNVPGKDIGLNAPTEKDKKDIEFAAEKGYDLVSLSFVKRAEDVEKVRDILEKHGSEMAIISKIEHRKAVENFDEILEVSDGIMVARGDLGVEMPAAKLPKLQKQMIQKSNKAGKPVITATQMLESMTENPTATRAEISDVGNAVMDGTDAVMLSGETAIGDYPAKTVSFMAEIVKETEKALDDEVHHTVKQEPENRTQIICKNAWQASKDIDASYIVSNTRSGSSAREVSKYRPEAPIMAFTDKKSTQRQLQLSWGVMPRVQESYSSVEDMVQRSVEGLYRENGADKADQLVITAGIPPSTEGNTNMMQIRTVEEVMED